MAPKCVLDIPRSCKYCLIFLYNENQTAQHIQILTCKKERFTCITWKVLRYSKTNFDAFSFAKKKRKKEKNIISWRSMAYYRNHILNFLPFFIFFYCENTLCYTIILCWCRESFSFSSPEFIHLVWMHKMERKAIQMRNMRISWA